MYDKVQALESNDGISQNQEYQIRPEHSWPQKLENADLYNHLINFEIDQWHVFHARNREEENRLIEAGFEYVRYSEKDQVAIYRKSK